MSDKRELIAQQNDQFRQSLGTGPIPGTVLMTAGIAALDTAQRTAIIQAVIVFGMFTTRYDQCSIIRTLVSVLIIIFGLL